ncbi:unnamed protein product [Arabidopsis thaliana]|uniref:(thale cress) hypothetical protein n=1 Tax=Arabidopsis thaliana TaxID=3702 RepID=A0A7G2ERM9_ARATH|nr:unnamed protein product [Arabidopsis thaliana]
MLCSVTQKHTHKMTLFFFYSLLFLLLLLRISTASLPATNYFDSFLPSDAVALLSFKSTADLDNKLLYSLTEPYDYCQWRGVDCSQDRVVRLNLDGVGLRGSFSPETLSRLDQLRVLSLENNSISGSIPDLSPLINLKTLTLSKNGFSAPVIQSEQNGEAAMIVPPVVKKVKNGWLVLGFTIGLASLIVIGLCLVVFSLFMKNRRDYEDDVIMTQPKREEENKEIKIQFQTTEPSPKKRIPKNGDLIFCGEGGGGGGEAMVLVEVTESRSRTSKAKPLHWTSCLKIAEDVAQALHYIHQSSAKFHGNLKSTNILLGHDFEACVTDYCLSVLTDSSVPPSDPDISSYKAPEIRKSIDSRPTSKCDVYSFGVFLLELLTGKTASRQPIMEPNDMLDWVRAMRQEEERSKEENGLEMMTQTACLCRVTSPEQRPTMKEVIKMIQEIKESVVMTEENEKFL